MSKPRNHLQLSITLAYAKGGYSVTLTLGSERAKANILLDTGSSTLAVLPRCYAPDRDRNLAATTLAQEVSYGKGAWAGPVLCSEVAFGEGEHSRSLSGSQFALVETDAVNFRDADGILGLAYRGLDHAHDVAALLTERGHNPALTWPWPFSSSDETDMSTIKHQVRQQPRVALTPFFSALEEHGVVADKFAMLIRRALVHVLDDAATSEQLACDPLNRGVLVLGGGEECQSLYEGMFQDIRILHDLYYNANLLSVQVGSQAPIAVPALEAQYTDSYASNAIIDTGCSFIVLEGTVYDAMLADFASHDARLPTLIERFQQRFQQEQGLPNSAIDTDAWPDLHFELESASGGVARLTCKPCHYWQRNALVAGQSIFLFMRQLPDWPNQSLLGLPLLSGRYCIFDRQAQGAGVVRMAKATVD